MNNLTLNESKLFQSRYTCRAYKNIQVDREILNKVFTDATKSPSWANSQPWEIFVAGGDTLEELRTAYLTAFKNGISINSDIPRPENWPEKLDNRMKQMAIEKFEQMGIDRDDKEARNKHIENNFNFFGAPVVAFLCMDDSLSEWSVLDMGQLSQSLMLAAQAHGLDSAPSYTFVAYPDKLRGILDIPSHLKIVLGISIGYGDHEHEQNQHKTSRAPLEEVVYFRGV
ncbi:nitroreductase [Bacillus thuringiensis]|uniref:Nitroreductase n=1 Tax=Bacillus thuringiensis TaxID=1428 RepID=A0A4R4B2C1_BACTU|nr:nitroreductase [Bacillus thuringiensis]TCW47586.1 nitroreductase [Bacillus thuringiensis]TCW47742.1 nitroreductase [Bacillus thuringiensis]